MMCSSSATTSASLRLPPTVRRPPRRPAPAFSPSATSPSTSPAAMAGGASSTARLRPPRGEVLGIAGLLGSGRTEILETLRLAPGRRAAPSRSTASRCIPSPRDARRLGVALVTEDRKATGLHLAPRPRNVALPSLGRLARFGVRSSPPRRGCPRRGQPPGVRCTGIEQVAATLSGGNQQKVVIGKWLATGPRVLLLDEPTRGIDVGAKQEIYDLDPGARRRGAGDPHGQLRAARAAAARRPHPGHVRGPADRRASRAEASEEAIMHLAAPARRAGGS